MIKRFQVFSAGLVTWLSLAALCGGCTSDPGDSGSGATGGAGSSAGNGGEGAIPGSGGSDVGGLGGDGGSGGEGPHGCGDPNWACSCDEGFWHSHDHDYYCDPWSACGEGEVTINVPNEWTDRVCARVALVDQFGTEDRDTATAVAANPDGTLCVSGQRFASPATDARAVGAYVRKYDPDGAVLWTQSFDGDGADVADVAIDAAGNCYSLGLSFSPQGGTGEWFFRKHSATGAVDWATTGSSAGQTPRQLAVDPDGNAIASFVTRSPEATDAPAHAELMKVDSAGALVWSASVGSDEQAETYFGLAGGEAMVVRSTGHDQYASTVRVTRLTEAGSVRWERSYKPYEIFDVKDMAVGPAGDAFLAGTATNSNNGTLFKLDPDGNSTPLGASSYLLTRVRSGEDGSVWLQDNDGIVAWTATDESSYGIATYGFPLRVNDFAPIPGFLVLVGEAILPLAGQTELGMGDAVVLKLRID
ncbi:MAG: hypothetical protein AB7K71_30670 [Polyangiaceae bacterium]